MKKLTKQELKILKNILDEMVPVQEKNQKMYRHADEESVKVHGAWDSGMDYSITCSDEWYKVSATGFWHNFDSILEAIDQLIYWYEEDIEA